MMQKQWTAMILLIIKAPIGAFLAVSSDAFCASLHAMKVMGIAGEKAAAISRENGSMMINFLDELCNLSGHE